jgi:hypothetical protein
MYFTMIYFIGKMYFNKIYYLYIVYFTKIYDGKLILTNFGYRTRAGATSLASLTELAIHAVRLSRKIRKEKMSFKVQVCRFFMRSKTHGVLCVKNLSSFYILRLARACAR